MYLTGKLNAALIDKLLSQAVADLSADLTLKERAAQAEKPPPPAPPMETGLGWQKVETCSLDALPPSSLGKPKSRQPARAEFSTDDKGNVYSPFSSCSSI